MPMFGRHKFFDFRRSRARRKGSRSVENGQAIGNATRLRDNLTTKVGHEAAPGGQLTLKDDSDAKITKGPKMKEKKLKSDKPDPSEEAQDQNKTKIIFQP